MSALPVSLLNCARWQIRRYRERREGLPKRRDRRSDGPCAISSCAKQEEESQRTRPYRASEAICPLTSGETGREDSLLVCQGSGTILSSPNPSCSQSHQESQESGQSDENEGHSPDAQGVSRADYLWLIAFLVFCIVFTLADHWELLGHVP